MLQRLPGGGDMWRDIPVETLRGAPFLLVSVSKNVQDTRVCVYWRVIVNNIYSTPVSTGIIADRTVNCAGAEAKGQTSPTKFALLRKDNVKNIAATTKEIEIGNQEININSNQLFRRIICTIKTDKELE